ncbi:hypothetical protein, partial [Nitrospirillum bahiense]|uniref:hypothetical protein n=1 Tax=Nitrospirillum amazonense TaxID=28077 RepID=UPI001B3C00EA
SQASSVLALVNQKIRLKGIPSVRVAISAPWYEALHHAAVGRDCGRRRISGSVSGLKFEDKPSPRMRAPGV